MWAVEFPGRYEDARGGEDIVWRMRSVSGPSGVPCFELRTTVRGAEIEGDNLDAVELADPAQAEGFTFDRDGNVAGCVLSGEMPCTVEVSGERRPSRVRFTLDLRGEVWPWDRARDLTLEMTVEGRDYSVVDDVFEGLLGLSRQFPSHVRLITCLTCMYSDYSPSGQEILGMRCHRGVKARYLAVNSKAEYFGVPVTEQVPETHLCEEYEPRVPGTGYRGRAPSTPRAMPRHATSSAARHLARTSSSQVRTPRTTIW